MATLFARHPSKTLTDEDLQFLHQRVHIFVGSTLSIHTSALLNAIIANPSGCDAILQQQWEFLLTPTFCHDMSNLMKLLVDFLLLRAQYGRFQRRKAFANVTLPNFYDITLATAILGRAFTTILEAPRILNKRPGVAPIFSGLKDLPEDIIHCIADEYHPMHQELMSSRQQALKYLVDNVMVKISYAAIPSIYQNKQHRELEYPLQVLLLTAYDAIDKAQKEFTTGLFGVFTPLPERLERYVRDRKPVEHLLLEALGKRSVTRRVLRWVCGRNGDLELAQVVNFLSDVEWWEQGQSPAWRSVVGSVWGRMKGLVGSKPG